MIDTQHLPCDLQESILNQYRDGLRVRMGPPILEFVRNLMPGYSTFGTSHADIVLDWMAHMLQHPNIKPRKAIVLVGPPGCGKGLFASLFTILLGAEKVCRTDQRMCRLAGTTLIHFDESNFSEDSLAAMKDLISAQVIAVAISDPDIIASYHRVLITTNTFPVQQEYRRFVVIPCGRVQASNFMASMETPHKIAALRQFLMERNVSAEL